MGEHALEVQEGKRFQFGKNWQKFLAVIDEDRIVQAEMSLKGYLGLDSLHGKTFLDIGSGSGIFSLAARRLGAKVHSFDYDPQSVECTKELKRRYFENDSDWIIEQGSVLDEVYMGDLVQHDIVYSWGVLHHTGEMWKALGNISRLVSGEGVLFISIYNDQGGGSDRWKKIKKYYNKMPVLLRPIFAAAVMVPREAKFLVLSTLKGRPHEYFYQISNYSSKSQRGMNYWYDLKDWVGGYPFEVAKPEEIFQFFFDRGFFLKKLKTCGGGIGCNEYVFSRHHIDSNIR